MSPAAMPGQVAFSSMSTGSTGVPTSDSGTILATLAFTAEPVHGLTASVIPSPSAGASPPADVAGASPAAVVAVVSPAAPLGAVVPSLSEPPVSSSSPQAAAAINNPASASGATRLDQFITPPS